MYSRQHHIGINAFHSILGPYGKCPGQNEIQLVQGVVTASTGCGKGALIKNLGCSACKGHTVVDIIPGFLLCNTGEAVIYTDTLL